MALHERIARAARLELECPVDFDVDLGGLRNDLEEIQARFAPGSHPALHFNPNGGWKSLNLRAPNGDLTATLVRKGDTVRDTEAMQYAPNTRKLLEQLGCGSFRVRFLSLEPGERVPWHHDDQLSIDFKKHSKGRTFSAGRFHIPVQTHADVSMNLCGTRCRWQEGRLYYGDFTFPHTLVNRSPVTRHHLVLDLVVNDDLLGRLPGKFLANSRRRNLLRPVCRKTCALFFKDASATAYLEDQQAAVRR